MGAILLDHWVLAYLAGLGIGGGLFAFLLKRYREVVAESDSGEPPVEPEAEEAVEPIKVVAPKKDDPKLVVETPEEKTAEPAKPAPVAAAPAPAPAPSAPPASEPKGVLLPGAAPLEKPDVKSTTLGLSPAVVYLQNLKAQMEHFEKEIHQLRGDLTGMVSRHDNQFDALLKRFGELQSELHRQVESHAAPAPAPVPKPVAQPRPAPAPAPAPKPVVLQPPAPAPAPAPQPQAAAPLPAARKEPVRIPIPGKVVPAPTPEQALAQAMAAVPATPPPAIEPEPVVQLEVQPPAAAPAPAPASEETMVLQPDESIPKPKGRGPVWPV